MSNRLVLFSLALGMAFWGCTPDYEPEVLHLATATDLRGFDPALATDIHTGEVMALVYDNLVRFDVGTELVPALARRWEVSPDGLKYTFYLVKNARFHDGTPVTAEAARYSFQRVLDPATRSPQVWLFDRIVGAGAFMAGETVTVEGLRVPNDTTLVINIQKPFAPFIQYLAMPSAAVVNRRQVENIRDYPAGSGPWKLERWERDGELVLKRNDDYWVAPPRLSKIKIRLLSEVMAQMAEFEAGNLDLLGLPDMEVRKWQALPQWKPHIKRVSSLNIYYVGMNCSRPPFDDVRLRKAMNLALDREKILELLLAGTGILASGPVPPVLLTEPAPNPYPYNPQQARELLKEAGYANGLHTTLWVSGDSELFHVLEAFQSYWQAVGVDVELLRSDWNVFKTAVREGKPDLYYLDWYADYPDAENFLYPLFHSSESMTKRNRYHNPTVDQLIEEIQTLSYGPEREQLIARANRLIFEDAPWVFLWYKQSYYITQPWLYGDQPRMIFNAERYLDMEKRRNYE